MNTINFIKPVHKQKYRRTFIGWCLFTSFSISISITTMVILYFNALKAEYVLQEEQTIIKQRQETSTLIEQELITKRNELATIKTTRQEIMRIQYAAKQLKDFLTSLFQVNEQNKHTNFTTICFDQSMVELTVSASNLSAINDLYEQLIKHKTLTQLTLARIEAKNDQTEAYMKGNFSILHQKY